jgi:dinuclear metal center YbgI/SA1388 family protein
MKISQIILMLESIAPPALQESYDNAGLLTGDPSWICTGALCTLDCTEAVVEEAIAAGVNLVVAHHPIIFGGLKKINGKNYVEKTIIKAIKHDIAIYAIHTNLDNVIKGVNGKMADKLGLINRSILSPKSGLLRKLYSFVPHSHLNQVRDALFAAGAGEIGNYSECSFTVTGTGTFKAGNNTNPFVGEQGTRHEEPESKFELIYPAYRESAVIRALKANHPYEEVAFDIVELKNSWAQTGSGIMGSLPEKVDAEDFLHLLASAFDLEVIKHTDIVKSDIQQVALCGGAGSFLLKDAIRAGADVYITADMKYHEFFDAEGRLMVCDIGHFESEQFTVELLYDILVEKFPTFAVLKSKIKTNPVNYFTV